MGYKPVKRLTDISFRLIYRRNSGYKGKGNGQDHTNADRYYTGGDISVGSCTFKTFIIFRTAARIKKAVRHKKIHLLYLSEIPNLLTVTVMGILNAPAPLTSIPADTSTHILSPNCTVSAVASKNSSAP